MTPDETDLIRRYIADELSPAAVDIAELLVLIDEEAAGMVDEAALDAEGVRQTMHQGPAADPYQAARSLRRCGSWMREGTEDSSRA